MAEVKLLIDEKVAAKLALLRAYLIHLDGLDRSASDVVETVIGAMAGIRTDILREFNATADSGQEN